MNMMRALLDGAERLKKAGVKGSRFEADLLLGQVLGMSRDKLYLERERTLSSDEKRRFDRLIARREKHEPLQYILGHQEFMGLDFAVDKRVLIPRADTEILVEKWLETVKRAESGPTHPRVLDLCTGSGAVAIAAAYYYPGARVTGTDISAAALTVARHNAAKLEVTVDWREGDFFRPVAGEIWDYILVNPPYVSVREYEETAPEIKFEPEEALLAGEDGLEFYRRLAREVKTVLAPRGRILTEIGSVQGEAVRRLFAEQGFMTEIIPDLAGRDRVVMARCEDGNKVD